MKNTVRKLATGLAVVLIAGFAFVFMSAYRTYRVQQGMCSHGCGVRFDVNPHGTTRQMGNGLVTRASTEQRDAALTLNLNCFVRLRGCKDIIDLLPTMWAHTGSGEIPSRFLGLSQKLEESHGFPSPDDI